MALDNFTKAHWYAIERPQSLPVASHKATRLLGQDIVLENNNDVFSAHTVPDRRELPLQQRYGHLWTTLGDDPVPIYDMPEFLEDGRRLVTAGAVTVRASGLRVVENFLDMAHFPFVHTGILGVEDYAEVARYDVDMNVDGGEVWATKCTFFQPQAAAGAEGGQISEYKYRVPHPFSTVLYKTCPVREGEMDLIGLFIQPRDEGLCDVHSFVLVFDDTNSDVDLLHFQQNIFLQDRMILENQVPGLLPLTPRAEMPTRADASSIAYRRWLKTNGVTYGVVPQPKAA